MLESRVGYNSVVDQRSQQLAFTKLCSYIDNKTKTYWYYGHSPAMMDLGESQTLKDQIKAGTTLPVEKQQGNKAWSIRYRHILTLLECQEQTDADHG